MWKEDNKTWSWVMGDWIASLFPAWLCWNNYMSKTERKNETANSSASTPAATWAFTTCQGCRVKLANSWSETVWVSCARQKVELTLVIKHLVMHTGILILSIWQQSQQQSLLSVRLVPFSAEKKKMALPFSAEKMAMPYWCTVAYFKPDYIGNQLRRLSL